MKTLIYVHSNSGHTHLICEYLANRLPVTDWTLWNIRDNAAPDPTGFDRIGFASWTYYMGIPPLMLDFIQSLPLQQKQPAFVLTTFGMMPGQGLKRLARAASARGFEVHLGCSIHCPENYPPFVLKGKGWDAIEAPTPKEMEVFSSFVSTLENWLPKAQCPSEKIKIGILNTLMRPASPQKARQDMGTLEVNTAVCNGCGICVTACHYGAIVLQTAPIFMAEACCACWNCFNSCPQQAIYTQKVGAIGQYAKMHQNFKEKLKPVKPLVV
ncbi:MAG: hypothetical protein CVU39_11415 [Chloroflexi bacterium HGW-Chloroflexi-10]|nr:MAG: hypothetical protein CVU39_11415 [Chloroflexi bacterium HGW-Chloroflexi-10]